MVMIKHCFWKENKFAEFRDNVENWIRYVMQELDKVGPDVTGQAESAVTLVQY
jgi:hypothetical protein